MMTVRKRNSIKWNTDCIKRSNGNFVIKDDDGGATKLEPKNALEMFWIK